MRRNKVLALILTLCLLASMTLPAFAAGTRGSSWPWTNGGVVAEEQPAGTGSSGVLTLVEDETTVTEGTELRASTYVLTGSGSSASAPVETYTAVPASSKIGDLAKSGETYYYLSDGVYYPVAFTKVSSGFFVKRAAYILMANDRQIAYLYATSTLSSGRITLYTKTVSEANAAGTMSLAADAAAYGGVTPYAGASSTTLKYFPVTMYNYDKTTINNATHQVEVDNGLGDTWNGIYFSDGNPSAESYTYYSGTPTYSSRSVKYNELASSDIEKQATNYYYTLDNSNYYPVYVTRSTTGWLSKTTTYTLYYRNGNEYHQFDKSTRGSASVTLYYRSDGNTTSSLSYAAWNFWKKGGDTNAYGQYTYSGLVESTLTANKDITFTKPDGGIFNSDATVKDIYTGVEMPFVYENGTYTFDASQNGVYFYEDSTQGSTAAQSNGRLFFDENNTQGWSGMDYGDGSKNLWAPFNLDNLTGEGSVDYHFGMRTTIPFTMTANGKMNPNDNSSTDITFSFSGDDDVWIFIDGQLVIDLGGIHNRLDATINFAQNNWNISESNASDDPVGDRNNAPLSGTLFNDGDTTGTLKQTRETFAATDSHELTIFYLERGGGSSNCKIEFNLPMKDTLSVKKLVKDTDSADVALDADTLSQINNRTFGFTLYKDGQIVANTNYSLLNENGQYISTPSTDASGHFELKNGQTAKFVGAIDNNSYYVVEDKDEGAEAFWQVPTWTYTANVAKGATSTDSNNAGESMTVTAAGSEEAEDSIVFTCTNTWVHQDKTSISAVDDKIVIDYGLPVVIDVLANDTVSNGTKSIDSVTTGVYGTATIDEGKIRYQLTKQLTGVEVLTYTVKATGSVESDNKTATANIYIIPATSMYYEENFTGLVTFPKGDWAVVGTAQTDPQEPGVVGTVGDSPYGSDAAYLNDSGDSNGSSKYVNTESGSASFSYTFTGTGTSFFVRTTSTSGYMRVVIKDSNETTKYTGFRDTSYKNGTDGNSNVTGGILYNIPVFTWDKQNYDTYTVTVTIAGGENAGNYGREFWLDGIRVINPLNSTDANVSVATAAYATDGEANMTVVTLRQKLLADYASEDENGDLVWDGDGFVIFTDTNGQIVLASEYNSNGPKEEVYLNNSQSVTFSLYDWDTNANKIYLGIKAPTGSGAVSINGNTLSINNAVDCYYDISNYAVITTDADGVKIATFKIEATSSLISVTNIKVTGSAEFTIVGSPDKDVGGNEGGDE